MVTLSEKRKMKGYTQAELGRLVGVSQQQIAKYESGLSTPSPKVAKLLVEELDICLADAWAMIYGTAATDKVSRS